MSHRKRCKIPRIARIFARRAQRPRFNLKEAFKRSHHVPKIRANFATVVRDRLKQTLSERHLTLTPSGSRAVRGAARRSVAKRNVDIRKLPDTRPARERPIRKQFERTAGRRNKGSAGRSH